MREARNWKTDNSCEFGPSPAAEGRTRIDMVGAVVQNCVEGLAALLVTAEAVQLLVGVIARYVFQAPIIWIDESASILPLWLGMIGSVVAYGRSEHMLMGTLIGRARPRTREFIEALSLTTGVGLLTVLIWPSVQFTLRERIITTPTLGISTAWEGLAFPVGLSLMAVLGVVRIAGMKRPLDFVGSGALLALIAGLIWIAAPWLQWIGNDQLIFFFVVIVGAAVLAGIPIAFAFGLGTCAYLVSATRTPLAVLIGRMDEGMSHSVLLATKIHCHSHAAARSLTPSLPATASQVERLPTKR